MEDLHRDIIITISKLTQLCKWCFIWPVIVERNGLKYTLKNSIKWTVVSHCGNIILGVWYLATMLILTTNESFERSLKFLPYFFNAILQCVFCYGTLCTSWDRTRSLILYLKAFKETNVASNPDLTKKIFRTSIVIFAITNVFLIIRLSFSTFVKLMNLPAIVGIIYIPIFLLMVMGNAYEVTFLYLVAQLGHIFQQVIKITEKDIARSITVENQVSSIETAMNRQQALRNAAAILIEGFNLPAAFGIVIGTLRMIIAVYILVPTVARSKQIGIIIFSFVYVIWNQAVYFYMINTCHMVKVHDKRMKEIISDTFLRIHSQNWHYKMKVSIRNLSYRLDYIRCNDLSLKPFGFVELDRTLIPKTLSLLSFYVVIYIQMYRN